MKIPVNIIMLGFSIITVAFMMVIGIAIAERSILGIILSIFAVFILTGLGFMTKKKMREQSR